MSRASFTSQSQDSQVQSDQSRGFGLVMVLVVILVLAVAGGAGWWVWQRNHNTTTVSNANGGLQGSGGNTTPTPKPDPYAGWQTYSNSTYGINLRYPTMWVLTEGAVDSPSSATKQEYAIGFKRNDNIKYNDTVSIEVLNESLSTAASWYDNYYAQSTLNHVAKTTNQLKGKKSVQYDVTNSGNDSKLYLFSVGSKTYLFASVDEALNVQAASNYWTTFSEVFDSLHLN